MSLVPEEIPSGLFARARRLDLLRQVTEPLVIPEVGHNEVVANSAYVTLSRRGSADSDTNVNEAVLVLSR